MGLLSILHGARETLLTSRVTFCKLNVKYHINWQETCYDLGHPHCLKFRLTPIINIQVLTSQLPELKPIPSQTKPCIN